MSDYIDVTVPFEDKMMCFPTDPQCSIRPHWRIANGDIVNLCVYEFGSHTGTHIDAPNHFVDGGKTIDELSERHFLGIAKVFDFSNNDRCIDISDVDNLDVKAGDIVLFKTRNSHLMRTQTFSEEFVYITPETARFLAGSQIATFGFDFLSIEEFGGGDGFGAHYALLGAGVVIIEGLDLSDVTAGEYDIVSLPMLVKGGNGSPIRVLLKEK